MRRNFDFCRAVMFCVCLFVTGGEAVVLMHEIGHSIGIGVVEWNVFNGWVEVYDRDIYSVMSYLSVNNAGSYGQWYYSGKYWNTKNMEYYTT